MILFPALVLLLHNPWCPAGHIKAQAKHRVDIPIFDDAGRRALGPAAVLRAFRSRGDSLRLPARGSSPSGGTKLARASPGAVAEIRGASRCRWTSTAPSVISSRRPS